MGSAAANRRGSERGARIGERATGFERAGTVDSTGRHRTVERSSPKTAGGTAIGDRRGEKEPPRLRCRLMDLVRSTPGVPIAGRETTVFQIVTKSIFKKYLYLVCDQSKIHFLTIWITVYCFRDHKRDNGRGDRSRAHGNNGRATFGEGLRTHRTYPPP